MSQNPGGNIRIYYSCNATPNPFITCWCKRWDEGNWDVTLEMYMDSSSRNILFENTIPGAVAERYNILGVPKYIDLTYSSGNTLIIEPQYNWGISGLTTRRVIGVHNISDSFLTPKLFNVKIEGFRLDM